MEASCRQTRAHVPDHTVAHHLPAGERDAAPWLQTRLEAHRDIPRVDRVAQPQSRLCRTRVHLRGHDETTPRPPPSRASPSRVRGPPRSRPPVLPPRPPTAPRVADARGRRFVSAHARSDRRPSCDSRPNASPRTRVVLGTQPLPCDGTRMWPPGIGGRICDAQRPPDRR